MIKEEDSSKRSLELGFVQQPFKDSNMGCKTQKCAPVKPEPVTQSSQLSKKRKTNPSQNHHGVTVKMKRMKNEPPLVSTNRERESEFKVPEPPRAANKGLKSSGFAVNRKDKAPSGNHSIVSFLTSKKPALSNA